MTKKFVEAKDPPGRGLKTFRGEGPAGGGVQKLCLDEGPAGGEAALEAPAKLEFP